MRFLKKISIFLIFLSIATIFACCGKDSSNVLKTVSLGSWNYGEDGTSKPIEWLVLERNGDGTAILLSKYAIEAMPYASFPENIADSDRVAQWKVSSIRQWLNSDFYGMAFSDREKEAIVKTDLKNTDAKGEFTQDFVDHWKKWDIDYASFLNEKWTASAGGDTSDNVWLLSIDDVEKYGNILKDGKYMQAIPSPYAAKKGEPCVSELCRKNASYGFVAWWLRSPGYNKDDAACVYADGEIYRFGIVADNKTFVMVRPAIKVDLSKI